MNGRILAAFISLILADHLATVQSLCQDNGNYSTNSTYNANINTALSSLSTKVDITGFYNVSVGQNGNRVNAALLCRGDVKLDECRDCAREATEGLVKSCPNSKQAIDWPDKCVLRYSNETIFGKLETDPARCWFNVQNATDQDKFIQKVRTLLDDLRVQAAYGGNSLRKVAAKNTTGLAFETIYALVQCTPDLSSGDCNDCLIDATADISRCNFAGKVGGKVGKPSCNLRFEIYSFFNETRLQELTAPPPLPPAPVPAPDRKAISTPLSGSGNNNTTKIVVAIIIVVIIVVIGCGIIFLRKRIKQRSQNVPNNSEEDFSNAESMQYDLDKIRIATNDFADTNILGEGGFGVVYKGKLENDQEIAVKRLSRNSGQGNVEFKNEVLLLLKLQHRNLVRLLGFSIQGIERLLIYEFIPNSSLDKFIFDPTKRSCLDWNRSYKIIVGIAKGLLYLHEDSRLRIIHRDLKASNILLDSELNPKIADFGMARLFEQNETQGNTDRVVGTYGYMPPEYAMHGQFSPKSDVFSFGVLVLEILTGRKNSCVQNEENMENLLCFVWKTWKQGTVADMIDPILRACTGSVQEMLRCIHIGLLCVEENVIDRPTMPSILLMLNSITMALPLPKDPAFCWDSLYGPISYDSKESNSSRNASKTQADMHEVYSINSMTMTGLHPR